MTPNTSRGCVKTPALNFGNDQILVMRNFDKMSRRIRWSVNEFSHSLSLEPTASIVVIVSPFRFESRRFSRRGSVLGR